MSLYENKGARSVFVRALLLDNLWAHCLNHSQTTCVLSVTESNYIWSLDIILQNHYRPEVTRRAYWGFEPPFLSVYDTLMHFKCMNSEYSRVVK